MSLSQVVVAILQKEENWRAFSSFCESVMAQKEKAERARRGEVYPSAGNARGEGRGGEAVGTCNPPIPCRMGSRIRGWASSLPMIGIESKGFSTPYSYGETDLPVLCDRGAGGKFPLPPIGLGLTQEFRLGNGTPVRANPVRAKGDYRSSVTLHRNRRKDIGHLCPAKGALRDGRAEEAAEECLWCPRVLLIWRSWWPP